MISPLEQITLIRKSLQIFICGILSFLPVVGFVPAVYAVGSAVKLGRRFRGEWNPAANYLNLGVALALVSIGVTVLGALIFALQLVPPFGGDVC